MPAETATKQEAPAAPSTLIFATEDPVAPVSIVTITDWGAAPTEEHEWQGGRGIDPWLIPEREYVQRQRRNAGLAAFIQLSFWVLGGKARS